MAQVTQDDIDAALKAYSENRRLADTLAADYGTIARSRFHGLRLLWFSIKSLAGLRSGRDRYAIWSPDLGLPHLPPAPKAAAISAAPTVGTPAAERPAHGAEEHLRNSWAARTETVAADNDPLVSVIIPVYNKIDVTMRCLQSIADTWFDTIRVQVIVVDDGSSDRTAEVVASVPGIDYVRNAQNQGFIGACNRGASMAAGRYLCFLNNDTEVRDAWLDHLVNTIEADSSVGIVGSKLVYPDGSLQEAGGIVWRDASGWNYGRGGDPRDARFNYMRDVDYCSGAALLIRAALFRQLGGFSKEYAPAYYEDADLCFAVRNAGYRVVYQPRSEVVHHEGLTSGTQLSSGTKRFQQINQPKFEAKWRDTLAKHLENSPARVSSAARRLRKGSTVLIIDSYVPMYDKDAGSARLLQIIKILLRSGYHVIFLPDNYAPLQPYTTELQALGVEVLHHVEGGISQQRALEEVLPLLDYAWICRPELFAKYLKTIRQNAATVALYDTIDLHFVRARREAAALGKPDDSWKKVEAEELSCARAADATIVVTAEERALLLDRAIQPVYVVPTLHDPEVTTARSFPESKDVLFIGGYNHTPNVDAAQWLCSKIMPLVWKRDPSVRIHLLGSNPPEAVKQLAGERVFVPGYLHDVSRYFQKSRVFVAPLRFGAGIKGKVGQALSYRLPAVLTDVAAEGFGFEDGRDCLIANDAAPFAEAILRLVSDEMLWRKISDSSAAVLEPFGTAAVGPRIPAMLKELRRRDATAVA